MTLFQWLQVAQTVVMGAAILLAWLLRAGIASGRWLSAGDSQAAAVRELQNRLEHGRTKISDLTDDVQTMPDRIREESDKRYQSKELSEERWTQTRRELMELEGRTRKLELVNARNLREN